MYVYFIYKMEHMSLVVRPGQDTSTFQSRRDRDSIHEETELLH